MNTKYYLLLLITLFFSLAAISQERFSIEVLSNPDKYGKSVESSIKIKETANFKIDTTNKVVLENGFRSATYSNVKRWTDIQYDVDVVSVTLVFSKYPIRKNGYSMNHKLLFNRLKNLFELDPNLNDSLIEYKILLQTNCYNDEQVDSLFHGVIIEYRKVEEKPVNEPNANIQKQVKETKKTSKIITNSTSAIEVLENIESFNDLPEDVLLDLQGRNPIEKTEILIDYFESLLQDTTETKITPEFLANHSVIVKDFINRYGNSSDSLVYKVFDRNRQWKNALVIADWTGSMYSYGAQALLWHTLNFETSGLDYFTLFNDGNKTSDKLKKIGNTEGIYFEKADNINKVVDLYNLVMLKGGGGDGPENDLEAIIRGIEKYPMHSEIILIADNYACVRDIELLDFIDEPIRVILCGYSDDWGINPQYLHIAKATRGSIHTIDLDIYNLQVELTKTGELVSIMDYDFKVGNSYCYNDKNIYLKSFAEKRVYLNLDSALGTKTEVFNLDLSGKSIEKVPSKITKFQQLESLNLSNNKIIKIGKPIYKSNYLRSLDLSDNLILNVPEKLQELVLLKELDLSKNKLQTLNYFPRFDYLTHLNLSGNGFSRLPGKLNLRSLQYLYLDGNNLKEVQACIGRLKRLKELTASGNDISKVSKSICYLRKLEILDLSDNNLEELPKQIGRLHKLKVLRISGNNFSSEYIAYLKEILPNTLIE